MGSLGLAAAVSLWHFLAVSCVGALTTGRREVGLALVADLVPKESLGLTMSLSDAARWVGGIIGFAAAGYAVQSFGTRPTFIMAALLVLLSIILLIPIREPGEGRGPEVIIAGSVPVLAWTRALRPPHAF